MPTVKYYSRSIKYVASADSGQRERIEYVKCETARVKNEKDVEVIKLKKSFLRFRTGMLTINECIARAKAKGSSEWYV